MRQEEFQEMHAAAYATLHRGIGVGFIVMGPATMFAFLADLAAVFY